MKITKPRGIALACMLLASALLPAASAFQVLPRISDTDRKLTDLGNHVFANTLGQLLMTEALPMIKHPVHEAITLNALGCEVARGDEAQCVVLDAVKANQVLLYGVRWPDDPPFALNRASPPRLPGCDARVTLRSTAQPQCWRGLFNDADSTAKQRNAAHPDQPAFGPGDYLLYRSHFGDLQFFHSMAAHDGEKAGDTLKPMRMWAQFLWGIATRTLPADRYLRTLGVDGLAAYFPGDMTATNLFATGIVDVRKSLDQVALGVLLHMVQDSFSQAHAGRSDETGAACDAMPRFKQPGRIQQFYSYAGQVGSKHDAEDTYDALGLQTVQHDPNVVDATRGFVTLWREGVGWSEAATYFDCVFALEDAGVEAGAGPFK